MKVEKTHTDSVMAARAEEWRRWEESRRPFFLSVLIEEGIGMDPEADTFTARDILTGLADTAAMTVGDCNSVVDAAAFIADVFKHLFITGAAGVAPLRQLLATEIDWTTAEAVTQQPTSTPSGTRP